jgi:acetyltransferase
LPDGIDSVIIATPAPTVPEIIATLAAKNVGGCVIISTGFSGIDADAQQRLQTIRQTAQTAHMPIIGPNCLGYMRPSKNTNASFARVSGHPGKIAFLSQSGALCTAILDWANENYVGFSAFVSVGDMGIIGFAELLRFFADDPETGSIIMYMESVTDAKNFIESGSYASNKKPVIVLKSGRSAEGTTAAKSHTGSLAGNDRVFDAAFAKSGILRVETIGQLFDAAVQLDMQRLPEGNRLAILTNAGGPGVIATDALIERKGQLATLSPDTIQKLSTVLPPQWSGANPVDILGDATPERYKDAIQILAQDSNIDGILVILTPQAMTDPVAVASTLSDIAQTLDKKIILTSWMGENDVDEGRKILERARIPVYKIPEKAVRCFMQTALFIKQNNRRNDRDINAIIRHPKREGSGLERL